MKLLHLLLLWVRFLFLLSLWQPQPEKLLEWCCLFLGDLKEQRQMSKLQEWWKKRLFKWGNCCCWVKPKNLWGAVGVIWQGECHNVAHTLTRITWHGDNKGIPWEGIQEYGRGQGRCLSSTRGGGTTSSRTRCSLTKRRSSLSLRGSSGWFLWSRLHSQSSTSRCWTRRCQFPGCLGVFGGCRWKRNEAQFPSFSAFSAFPGNDLVSQIKR